jgi:hypothetical protein
MLLLDDEAKKIAAKFDISEQSARLRISRSLGNIDNCKMQVERGGLMSLDCTEISMLGMLDWSDEKIKEIKQELEHCKYRPPRGKASSSCEKGKSTVH